LAIFDSPPTDRCGCPFHNAAVGQLGETSTTSSTNTSCSSSRA
jgi:hypothetical protein